MQLLFRLRCEVPIQRLTPFLVGCFWIFFSAVGYAQPICEVQRERANNIRVCDSIEKVFTTFQKDFVISEINRPPTVLHFNVADKSNKRTWFVFSVDNNRRIIHMDIEGPCFTKEGIGVGSTLGDATRIYGRADVEPTDVGCYVYFKKLPMVGFLLNNDDIPRSPCLISDDEFTSKHKGQVLKYQKARIVAIQLTAEDSCPDPKGGTR